MSGKGKRDKGEDFKDSVGPCEQDTDLMDDPVLLGHFYHEGSLYNEVEDTVAVCVQVCSVASARAHVNFLPDFPPVMSYRCLR